MIWFSSFIFLVCAAFVYEKDRRSHAERRFLLEQAERERNQLMNRVMSGGNIHEYRQQVITEATVHETNEQEVRERLMDETYGPGWREMG